MFAKLRTNRYMKASGDDSAAVVEFTGKVQRIARVHQSGLRISPRATAPLFCTRPVSYWVSLILISSSLSALLSTIWPVNVVPPLTKPASIAAGSSRRHPFHEYTLNASGIARAIRNLIRTGIVTEVDLRDGLCRVQTGGIKTTWLNWLTSRAGRSRVWWAPSVGEQVMVLAIGGELDTAFVLPAIFSDDHPAPSASADALRIDFPDGRPLSMSLKPAR
jgi:hypothetical protein